MDVSDVIRVMEAEESDRTDQIIRDGKNVYLRIPLDQGFEAGYTFRMISGIQPACLLPVGIVREGHQVFADYRISGWTSLSSVPPEDLLDLLYGFVNTLRNAAEELADCLLTADDLSLDPGHIFLRRETGEIRFCYMLEGGGNFGRSLQELMEFFIKTAKPEGEQEVLLLYGLYQKSREENVTPEILASLRTELMNGQNASSPGERSPSTEKRDLEQRSSSQPFSPGRSEYLPDEDEETREIYEKLGLDPFGQGSGSLREKKERAPKKDMKAKESRRPETDPERIPVKEITDLEEKPQSFFRKHLPELLIGAAAVILAICALVL